jgi:hypothetical protein
MGLKLLGTKLVEKEVQNGHATDDALDAEDAEPDEEEPG